MRKFNTILPLKILFVIDSLGFGGAERQLVELVKALVEKNGYQVHLISLLKRNEGYLGIIDELGVKVQYYPRGCKYDMLSPLLGIIGYIREKQIDLVHGFMNIGSLFGALAAKATGRPVVCSAIREGRDSTRKEKYLKRFLAILSDIYVANSRAGFASRFATSKPHFRVVYNGVDFSRFQNEPDLITLKNKLGVSRYGRIVGMVGSLSINKDQDTLLSAAPQILAKYSDVGFLFVGDGINRDVLLKKAKSLGIERQVVFAGYRTDVDLLYFLMDVCVLLTNSRVVLEGIPNVMIEAMACGVPVVASDGGGTPEVIEDGKTGILVPSRDPGQTADAIISILGNPELSRPLVRSAFDFVREKFGLERYSEEYENIYGELLVAK